MTRFLLVYSSQTGQAKAIAEEVCEKAASFGLNADIHCVSQTEKKFWLERESCFVFITSTTGDGEPPETALKFWRRLRKKTLPSDHLKHVSYALLGLGDSNYTSFCNCAKMMEKRFQELGAKSFYASRFADDAVGLENTVEPWMEGLFPALLAVLGCKSDSRSTSGCDSKIDPSLSLDKDAVPQIEASFFGDTLGDGLTETLSDSVKLAKDPSSADMSITEELHSNSVDITKEHHNGSDNITKESHANSDSIIKDLHSNSDNIGKEPCNTSVNVPEDLHGQVLSDFVDHSSDGASIDKNSNSNVVMETSSSTCDVSVNAKEKVCDDFPALSLETKSCLSFVVEIRNPSADLTQSSLRLPPVPQRYLSTEFLKEQVLNVSELPSHNGILFPSASAPACHVPITAAKVLTRHDAVKKCLKITLDITGTEWSYEPGDTFGFICPTSSGDVQDMVDRLGLTDRADTVCHLSVLANTKKRAAAIPPFLAPQGTVRHWLTYCDLRSTPKKSLVRALVEFTSDSRERRRLQELCSREGSEDYRRFVTQAGVGIIQFLELFPSCKPPLDVILEHLPCLMPRPYSAASWKATSVDFVFTVVVLSGYIGQSDRTGVCTGWLDRLTTEIQTHEAGQEVADNLPNILVPVFPRSNQHFRPLKDLATPVVMVGPGTGVAPFIGFLQQRQNSMEVLELKEKLGESWLFFGCRHRERDFIFRKELESFVECGALTRLVVSFSREQEKGPKYVQDNIRLHGDQLSSLMLHTSAHFYICGDAKNMTKDVRKAFASTLELHKGLTTVEAEQFLNDLVTSQKRYHEDVWF